MGRFAFCSSALESTAGYLFVVLDSPRHFRLSIYANGNDTKITTVSNFLIFYVHKIIHWYKRLLSIAKEILYLTNLGNQYCIYICEKKMV